MARRNSMEAALQLGEGEMEASAKSRPAAHHSAKVAYPRVGLSAWLRLRETPATRCDTNELGEGSAEFPHLSGCDIIAAAELSSAMMGIVSRVLESFGHPTFFAGEQIRSRSGHCHFDLIGLQRALGGSRGCRCRRLPRIWILLWHPGIR